MKFVLVIVVISMSGFSSIEMEKFESLEDCTKVGNLIESQSRHITKYDWNCVELEGK